MELTLTELSAINTALLRYRNQLRETTRDVAAVRQEQLSMKVMLQAAEDALVKIQDQIRKQAETYR